MARILQIYMVFFPLEGITGKVLIGCETGFFSGLGSRSWDRPARKILTALFLSLKTFLGVGILTADAMAYIPTPMSNFLNRNEMSCVKVSSRERDQRI